MAQLFIVFVAVCFIFLVAWPFGLMINYVFSEYILEVLFGGPLGYWKSLLLFMLGGGPLAAQRSRK